LSEFLEPEGRLIFGEGDAETRWIVEGEDELRVED